PDGTVAEHRGELEAFFAGLMADQLEARNVPGAVVSVVQDGEVVFARGYGHADVAAREPVDPETTLFRIGSVSKLFTYTAAMQLVEEGLLDLDADVNDYLDPETLQVPEAFGEPGRCGRTDCGPRARGSWTSSGGWGAARIIWRSGGASTYSAVPAGATRLWTRVGAHRLRCAPGSDESAPAGYGKDGRSQVPTPWTPGTSWTGSTLATGRIGPYSTTP
ncbi:MAG: serine hydrolase domain-containing protein, partial [Gemmatimonadota bacterium]